MDVDTALLIAHDPLATRWELTEVARLLAAEVTEHRRLQTLGGPPPAVDTTWGNRDLDGGVHVDCQGRL